MADGSSMCPFEIDTFEKISKVETSWKYYSPNLSTIFTMRHVNSPFFVISRCLSTSLRHSQLIPRIETAFHAEQVRSVSQITQPC